MLQDRRAVVPAGDEDELFSDLGYWQAQYQWKQVRELMEKDGDDDFVIHMLRHTFCSRLVQKGVPIQVVQKLAGHKNISITLRYAHLNDEALMRAIHGNAKEFVTVASQADGNPLQPTPPAPVTCPSQPATAGAA